VKPRGALLCLTLLPVASQAQSPSVRFDPVVHAVEDGIRQGLYPGAVLVVGRRDTILFARGFGTLTWDKRSARPSAWTTFWDLASLTKVVATTGALTVLVDRGSVDLDAPVSRYLPRFSGPGKERVTVRMLLDHTSGLRAYVPLHRLASTRARAIDLVYAEPLTRLPGTRAVYSDLNAILLGWLVEAVAGVPLSNAALELVFDPLKMGFTAFGPLLPEQAVAAPSRQLAGRPNPRVVDDANARRLGGVAGHAGLFSTGLDLAKYAQTWLRRGALPGGAWASEQTITAFLARSPSSGSRVLGWDTPDREIDAVSSFGTLTSDASFGHTGWTGTLLWIDPERDLFLVFLSNRSLAPRNRNSLAVMRTVRAQVSDLATRAALAECSVARTVVC